MRALGGCVLALLCSCLEPTQMTIEVRVGTPLSCDEGDLLVKDLELFAERGSVDISSPSIADVPSCKGSSFGDVVFIPHASDDEAPVQVLAIAQAQLAGRTSDRAKCYEQIAAARAGEASGCVPPESAKEGDLACEPCIAASASFRFVAHTPLSFSMTLTTACQGVFCEAGKTCGDSGACVADEVQCRGTNCERPTGSGGEGAGAAGGSGGGGGQGGAGGAGGASPWLPLAGFSGAVFDLAATTPAPGDTQIFAAGAQGFFQCSASAQFCTPIDNKPFDRVVASGNSAYALSRNALQVLRNDTSSWSVDSTCSGAPIDIAWNGTNEPAILTSASNTSSMNMFALGNLCTGNAQQLNCYFASGAGVGTYASACANRMVLFMMGASPSVLTVALDPSSLATVTTAIGQRHFVCSGGNLMAFDSRATSIVQTTVTPPRPCTLLSVIENDRLFTYDATSGELTAFPLNAANEIDLTTPVVYPLTGAPPPIHAIAAAPGGIALGTASGILFRSLP